MEYIMRNKASFCGSVLLFAGDFQKVLSVVLSGSKAKIVNVWVKSYFLYHKFQIVRLIENMTLQALLQDFFYLILSDTVSTIPS